MATTMRNIQVATMLSKYALASAVTMLLAFAGLFGMPSAEAAERFTYYSSTGPVTAMGSHDSTLWCGTEFGLIRWNTEHMTYDIFRVPDGLPQAHIVDLDIASDGTVWVATAENGVASFNGTSWKSYSTADGLPHLHGLSIHAAENGTVYAGVYTPGFYDSGGGLSRFDGDTWTSTSGATQYDSKNLVRDIASDPNGTVWAVCGGKLASVVDSTWTFYEVSATHVLFDTGGTLWVHTGTWISHSLNGTFSGITLPNGFMGKDIVAFDAPAGGGILVLTRYGGLAALAPDGGATVLSAGGAESRFTALTIDESGTVWAGMSDGGIARFTEGGWKVSPLSEPTLGNAAYEIKLDADNIPWAITDQGLFRYLGGIWKRVDDGKQIPNFSINTTYSFFFDADRKLWLHGFYNNLQGSFYRIIRYLDNETLVPDPVIDAKGHAIDAVPDNSSGLWLTFEEGRGLYRYDNGLITEIPDPMDRRFSIVPFVSDNEGGIWCKLLPAWSPQLYRFYNGVWEPHPEVFAIAYESYVTGLVSMPDGSAWISAEENVSSHGPRYSSRILHKSKDSEQFTPVHSLDMGSSLHCVDQKGRLWVSRKQQDPDLGLQYYGVTCYDGDTTVTLDETRGLPENQVYDIVADSNNAIWIATAKGIVRYADETTGVAEESESPSTFDIVTAFPNPFNPSTTISFTLPRAGTASVVVYSITGQKIRTLVTEPLEAGKHQTVWNGLDRDGVPAASGIYFVRVTADGYQASGKITLLR